MIEKIEDGMPMGDVRSIINQLIDAVNALPSGGKVDYNELQNKPAINGVELDTDTLSKDLNIDLEPLGNYEELQASVISQAATTANKSVSALDAKVLKKDFTLLDPQAYEITAGETLVLLTEKGDNVTVRIDDLANYLKSIILKNNGEFMRVIES